MIAKRRQRVLASLMEMHGIFLKTIIGGQIHSTAKPECDFTIIFFRHEHAHIHMHGGCIRVTRVEYQ